ncbi:MAG: protein of unknown function DUF1653 [uncultured bacterium (gcode 4)]|uniref:DUF1653 domain-containing protein n=1 Tax=uncultured bacterium (gcode 4) TaxID=1234023 RepID=K2FEV2_9BACT|nr:MAG: protein of unknown function DUF1653 [uncultured bacterium (gcode 4)]
MDAEIKIWAYRHFKWKEYEVIWISRHSETLEEFVVYRHSFWDNSLWIRPLTMFTETVEKDGKIIPRFKYIWETDNKS